MRARWDAIPVDLDVLITHTPPRGTLDRRSSGAPIGCEQLAAALPRVRPRVHLFGHVHASGGQERTVGPTTFVNAACTWRGGFRGPMVLEL